MIRVSFHTLEETFLKVLCALGFDQEKAGICATVFAENSRDGINSHGLNRFAPFVEYIRNGHIDIHAEPSLESAEGALETWNGNLAPGILNAKHAMARAIALSKQYRIGCVAIRNTNHWMRGGTYGWQAADAGCIGICFTNTIANMPAWGGIDPRLGNNPLVIAVPRKEGPIVLDMAMSQYAYGKLHEYQLRGEKLPFAGGFDKEGALSVDAGAIIESRRSLPVGFWKGAGLSLMLDLLVTVLSRGKSTAELSKTPIESGISQVFICIDPKEDQETAQLIAQVLSYTKSGKADKDIYYPGERMMKTRRENMEKGIPVDETIWQTILDLV